MAFKKEIIALLRKREGVQLSGSRIEQIATVLDAEVVEEADIETAIETYNKYNPLAEIAKTDDKIRSLEKKAPVKTAEEIAAEEKAAKEKAEKEKVPSDVPEWAKALIESAKATNEKLAKLEGTKVVNDRKAIATEKFKDAGEEFKTDLLADLEEINFKDDDHFNSYLERKEKTFGNLKAADVLGNLGDGKVAKSSSSSQEKQVVAAPAVVDDILNNI